MAPFLEFTEFPVTWLYLHLPYTYSYHLYLLTYINLYAWICLSCLLLCLLPLPSDPPQGLRLMKIYSST